MNQADDLDLSLKKVHTSKPSQLPSKSQEYDVEAADLAKTFRKAKFHTHSCELFQGFPCRCFFHEKASPKKCRSSSLSGSVNVAVSLDGRHSMA
jgi:hypothetical protein